MELKEAVKIEARITNMDENGFCHIQCDDCPISANNNGLNINCTRLLHLHPDKYEQILKDCAKGHPIKSNKDTLLEAFPNTEVDKNGLPHLDPCDVGLIKMGDRCDEHSCEDCRKEYWNKEYKGRCEDE